MVPICFRLLTFRDIKKPGKLTRVAKLREFEKVKVKIHGRSRFPQINLDQSGFDAHFDWPGDQLWYVAISISSRTTWDPSAIEFF
jgi:hypothetical protein